MMVASQSNSALMVLVGKHRPFTYQPKPMALSLNNRDSLTLAEDSGLFGDIMDIDGAHLGRLH